MLLSDRLAGKQIQIAIFAQGDKKRLIGILETEP
jgi:hypothetical protein